MKHTHRHDMSPTFVSVGDRNTLAIEAGFMMLDLPAHGTAALTLTEGYLTFIVGGYNIFQLNPDPQLPSVLLEHTPINLSMFLEWIYYDKAYNLTSGSQSSFCELIAGDSSPPVTFRLDNDDVAIQWDFRHCQRCGLSYENPIGEAKVNFREYLICLATISDLTIAATQWRAMQVDRQDEWQQWLHGYRPERDAFYEYVRARL